MRTFHYDSMRREAGTETMPPGHSKFRWLILAMFATSILSSGSVFAQYDYLLPQPLPRLAMLVGAQEYIHLSPLKNVQNDVRDMYSALDALGFTDVLVVTDPCQQTMLDATSDLIRRARVLAPDGGATIVVSFAGHGAMSGHESYALPIDFDLTQLTDYEIHEVALPVSHLEKALVRARVGAALVLFDACRNELPQASSGDVKLPNSDCERSKMVWQKMSVGGSVTPIGHTMPLGSRLMTAFSTGPGRKAFSKVEEGSSNSFVASVVNRLSAPTPTVPDMFSDVYRDVVEDTHRSHYPLEPDVRLKGLSRITLREYPHDLAAQRDAWTKALEVGKASRSAVKMFVRSYPTSVYFRPALQWLKDHGEAASILDLVPIHSNTEFSRFRTMIASGVVLQRHPIPGAGAQEVTSQPREVELELDRHGDWLRIVGAHPDSDARFVATKDVGTDLAELPNYWLGDGVRDVTSCLEHLQDLPGSYAACINSQIELADTQQAARTFRILSVERSPELGQPANLSSRTGFTAGVSSEVAFNRAVDTQLALQSLGVPLKLTQIHVVVAAFAPELSGRVLISVANH